MVERFQEAAGKGSGHSELIEQDEAFEFLRGEPQFAAALEKIRAQAETGKK